jgi:hypothetical protein
MLSTLIPSRSRRLVRTASSWFDDARNTLGDINLGDLPLPHRRHRRSPWSVALVALGLMVVAGIIIKAVRPSLPSADDVQVDSRLEAADPRADIC